MACNGGCRFTPNLVVGLTITLAGGVLLLDNVGVLEVRDVLRFWPVLLVLFGASLVGQALRGPSPGVAQRPIVGPGFVIVLVFLGLMVSNAYRNGGDGWPDRQGQNVFAVMSKTTRASREGPFRGADMMTFMGQSRLDLREATLAPGDEAYIDVFGMMGTVHLVVPEGWDVEVQAVPMMGQVRDRRLFPSRYPELLPSAEAQFDTPAGEAAPETREDAPLARERAPAPPSGPAPRLVLRGFIMMGALYIES